MKPTRWLAPAAAALITAVVSACAPSTPPPPPPLYQRIGMAMVAAGADDGKQGLTQLVDQFVGNVAADPRIYAYFRHTDIPHLKHALVEQICQATGGPCVYASPSMRDVHRGMHVTNPAFDALVEDLVKAMNTYRIPDADQQELLALLGPMRQDIVEAPASSRSRGDRRR
jgi:hemoglobin